MKWHKVLLMVTIIAIGIFLMVGPGSSKIPEPDNIFYGTVSVNGSLVLYGTVTLTINGSPNPIASYDIGSIVEAGNNYILRVPIDAIDPQEPDTARPGDTASIYFNGVLAKTGIISERGSIQVANFDVGGPADTDGDGLTDDIENATCTDPYVSDTDNDGLLDGEEDANLNGVLDTGETDPCQFDTDGDGIPDGWEIRNGLDPLVDDATGDPDQDGFSNLEEYENGTDPNVYDETISPPFTFTSTPAYLFIYGEAFINHLPVEPGDWIGVFAPGVTVNNGCIGAFKIEETKNYVVTAYGDDTSTPEKDGASTGDELTFIAWDTSQGHYEYLCSTGPDESKWVGHNEVININLTNNCQGWQGIPLAEGWNLISYQVKTCVYDDVFPVTDPNLFIIDPNEVEFIEKESLLSWLLDDANSPIRDAADPNKAGEWQRITSFDHNGAHLLDKDLPEFVNTLHYFSLGYGYWIKMNKDGYLVVQGQPATADISLNLKDGWNLMGFIPPDICYAKDPNAQADICPYQTGVYQQEEGILYCPLNPMMDTVFVGIAGKYQRITSFDRCAGAMLFDIDLPDFVNTLDYIGPKYGYWIKMLGDGGMVFPDGCPDTEE